MRSVNSSITSPTSKSHWVTSLSASLSLPEEDILAVAADEWRRRRKRLEGAVDQAVHFLTELRELVAVVIHRGSSSKELEGMVDEVNTMFGVKLRFSSACNCIQSSFILELRILVNRASSP